MPISILETLTKNISLITIVLLAAGVLVITLGIILVAYGYHLLADIRDEIRKLRGGST
jgi:hypothetical protein